VLLFACFGWEAITHLAFGVSQPHRDVPMATISPSCSVSVISLGGFAVVATAYARRL
jgi:amino acid transporter